jgi:hypothetical protein
MLELELMHRWSTKTWQILYAVPVCRVSVQQHLTRASLGYTFMTKAILAAAALDTAMYGGGNEPDSRAYHRAALQLMNEASADYRRQLQGSITRDNLWLLSEFSVRSSEVLYYSMRLCQESSGVLSSEWLCHAGSTYYQLSTLKTDSQDS